MVYTIINFQSFFRSGFEGIRCLTVSKPLLYAGIPHLEKTHKTIQ